MFLWNGRLGDEYVARKSKYPENNKIVVCHDHTVRVGIYARLSETDGDNVISDSILNQIAIANKELRFRPNFIYVKTYIDDGYSGRNFNRPGFQEMMRDLMYGIINCVIVKDVSRLGRNYIEVGNLLVNQFTEMEVRFVSVNNEYDSAYDEDGMPEVDVILQTVLDDNVSRDISKKVKSSIDAKINNGDFLPPSGSIGYGYLRDAKNNTYTIDDDAAWIVRLMYSMREKRQSYTAIANYLNDKGFPCPGKLKYLRGHTKDPKYKDALWIRGTVRKILSDPIYIGCRVHGKLSKPNIDLPKQAVAKDGWIIIEDTHPAIIKKEQFYVVQNINEEEQKKLSPKGQSILVCDYREALKGKLFCADCGALMTAKIAGAGKVRNTPNYIVYDCGSYRNSNHLRCSSHYIREDTIISEIVHLLNETADRILSDAYRKTVYEPLKADLVKLRKTILELQKEKERSTDELARMFEAYSDGKITREEFKKFSKSHREESIIHMEQEDALVEEMKVLDQRNDTTQTWIKKFRQYKKNPDITCELLEVMVDRISIYQGQRLAVEYNFQDLGI